MSSKNTGNKTCCLEYHKSPKMQDVKYLLEKNKSNSKQAKIFLTKEKERWVFEDPKTKKLDSIFINNFLCAVNYIIGNGPKQILLILNNVEFKDKLVLKILECICYYLIDNEGIDVYVKMKAKKNFLTNCVDFSPLLSEKPQSIKYFFKDDNSSNYFRRIICYSGNNDDYITKKSNEVLNFLIDLRIKENISNDIAKTVSELLGNAIEHGESDCILDIDVSDDIPHPSNSKKMVNVISVAIMNFSETPIYSKLKEKMSDTSSWGLDSQERYSQVQKAYDFHKNHFNKNYSEDDFFTISSFQDEISGEKTKEDDGGIGLTNLIRAIEEKTNGYMCYMLSGNRILNFKKNYLHYDENMFIGFNSKNDFFNCIPDKSVFGISGTYFPGVAYNLNFMIYKEERKHD